MDYEIETKKKVDKNEVERNDDLLNNNGCKNADIANTAIDEQEQTITRKMIESMMIAKCLLVSFFLLKNCNLVMMVKYVSGSHFLSTNQDVMIDFTGNTHNSVADTLSAFDFEDIIKLQKDVK